MPDFERTWLSRLRIRSLVLRPRYLPQRQLVLALRAGMVLLGGSRAAHIRRHTILARVLGSHGNARGRGVKLRLVHDRAMTDDLGQGLIAFFAASITDFIEQPSIEPHAIIDNHADCKCLAECIPDEAQRDLALEHLNLAIKQLCDAVGENDPQAFEQAQWWAREQLEAMKAQAR